VIVASVPEVSAVVPERLALLALRGRPDPIGPTRGDFLTRQQFVQRNLEALARWPGVRVIEPASVLCTSGRCSVDSGGVPLYRDSDHLSRFGAEKLGGLFVPVF
jgi:hypothetical protein